MLPNLLPQQHGVASAASAYIPGTELPDAVPSPTPDQVSHLPPPAPLAAACSACPAPGGGIRSRAAPLRSAHVRCATTWQLSKVISPCPAMACRKRASVRVWAAGQHKLCCCSAAAELPSRASILSNAAARGYNYYSCNSRWPHSTQPIPTNDQAWHYSGTKRSKPRRQITRMKARLLQHLLQRLLLPPCPWQATAQVQRGPQLHHCSCLLHHKVVSEKLKIQLTATARCTTWHHRTNLAT